MKRLQDDRSLTRKATRRRQYEAAFKRQLVELSLVPGASVAKIALDHRLNANILFKWRRYHLHELARATPKSAAGLLPVTMIEPQGTAVQTRATEQDSRSQRQRQAPRLGNRPRVLNLLSPQALAAARIKWRDLFRAWSPNTS